MNLDETITLIECLRESGATHFKSRDLEVSFVQTVRPDVKRKNPGVAPLQREASPKEESQAPLFKENSEDTEKAKELIATLRNPEKLMDVIFPEGAGI